jgi:hypothetical protein
VARRQRLSTSLLTVFCGLAVLAVGGLGWAHRHDLKRRLLWWEVRRLEAFRAREPEAPAFQPTENRGLSPFEVAFSRLVKLQKPGFLGGTDVLLFPLRGRHGKTTFAAVYEPMRYDFESPKEKGEEIIGYFCNCRWLRILLLDGGGTLLGDSLGVQVWGQNYVNGKPWIEEGPIRAVSRGSYDVLQLLSDWGCGACYDPLQIQPWREFSVDAAGLVDQGLVATDVPGAPVCVPPSEEAARLPSFELGELLGSCGAVDAHRVLTDVEQGDAEDAMLVEPLLHHEEPLVRARAAVIASRVPGLREQVLSLLDDPDPGVRAGAIIATRNFPGWEDSLLPLTRDPDEALARRARLELSHSHDPGYARPAILGLVRDRNRAAMFRLHRSVANGELADALLDWLSEPVWLNVVRWEIGSKLRDAYSREDLLERIDRLIKLYAMFSLENEGGALYEVLARLDDPRADAALIAELERPDSSSVSSIVSVFYDRGTPVRAAAARKVLAGLLEENSPCDWASCKVEAAILLAELGWVGGLRWLIENREREEGELILAKSIQARGSPGGNWEPAPNQDAYYAQATRHRGWGVGDGERP